MGVPAKNRDFSVGIIVSNALDHSPCGDVGVIGLAQPITWFSVIKFRLRKGRDMSGDEKVTAAGQCMREDKGIPQARTK